MSCEMFFWPVDYTSHFNVWANGGLQTWQLMTSTKTTHCCTRQINSLTYQVLQEHTKEGYTSSLRCRACAVSGWGGRRRLVLRATLRCMRKACWKSVWRRSSISSWTSSRLSTSDRWTFNSCRETNKSSSSERERVWSLIDGRLYLQCSQHKHCFHVFAFCTNAIPSSLTSVRCLDLWVIKNYATTCLFFLGHFYYSSRQICFIPIL